MTKAEQQMEALGIGYTRTERCIMDLVKAIHMLVEQNALLLQAMAGSEEHEPEDELTHYLNGKRV